MSKFKDFLGMLMLSESLHPEIHAIVSSKTTNKSKQSQLAAKIKDLVARGEATGIEGNSPKGSSRQYLPHAEPHHTIIDGKPASFKIGTKVAITATLDKHHRKADHDGLSLGQLQNRAENADSFTDSYRVLHKDDKGNYTTNHETGIFPPLVHHDEKNHEHSTVGHSRNIKPTEFSTLTKTESHPAGITHTEFVDTLNRFHNRNNGRYWEGGKEREAHLDHIESHPLLQKFMDFHGNTGSPPYDYAQIKNMGVFEHPNGTKHIVARDHGFDSEVASAYTNANRAKYHPHKPFN